VIGSDSRRPADKRRILELYAEHGYMYPDTAMMAFHRGRFDLLEQHLARDPQLLSRQYAIGEIFPPEVGCNPAPYEAMGTPVDGGTLLHLAVYWDELDMAEWLLARGADPNARAAVDADGFGGHTALFGSVVSQAAFWINYPRVQPPKAGDARFTELLLARGADPNVRASIRMRLGEGHGDPRIREFRDVTPLAWGRRFSLEQVPGKHREILFVNAEAMRVLEAHGGEE
jgi:ankyrin repeat protein